MTQLADVIKNAMTIIDDVRLTQLLSQNPALFYRKMCGYVDLAIPMLSSPPELYTFITDDLKIPEFADATWETTGKSLMEETQVETGKIGYELCSVSKYSDDGKSTTPYLEATYDAETGIVTFPVQENTGITYDIDFYNDGSVADLSPQIMRLFALAVAVVWNERLDNNWLNIQPKIKDSAFETVNESNYIDKMTARAKEKRLAFAEELKKFEQMTAYQKTINRRKTF